MHSENQFYSTKVNTLVNVYSWVGLNRLSNNKARLKGHSQLVHMRIRYHFLADLHFKETRSILFLSKFEK